MNLWLSGVVIFILLLGIAFLGYVLAWGQMSFWGATVIINIFTFVPSILEFICGGFYVSNPTLLRYFLLHFILPFITLSFVIIHFSYLHYVSSSNPLGYNTNNLITIFPNTLIKDIVGLLCIFILYTLQLFIGIFSLSHPDNSIEVNNIFTPLHIVPEWYMLYLYAVLKAIPNKQSGFITLITSLIILISIAELKNISTITRLTVYMSINGNIFLTYLSTIFIGLLSIGAQLPQDILLSYGRVLSFFNM